MSKNHSLTYKEIVILHLRDFLDINEEITSPPDITQKGIANKVGMSRTHVSRVMKELTEEGLVFEKLSNIENKNRKMKIYRLTNKGVREYEEIISELNNSKVSVIIEKKEIEVPIPEIPEIIDGNIDVVDVLSMLRDTDDRLDLNEIKPKEKVKDIEECPEIDKLYQIEGVLEELKTWVQRDVPIVVVKGRKGCGASSVVSKFIKEIEDFHFCWVNVN
ncbi:MAG: helix-turn-helix domain-containing protein, partial [Thermoplasmatota archaeon]